MKRIDATWSAPAHVHAFTSTRDGGVSLPPYDALNLGDHVGDEPQAVATNRERLLSSVGLTAPAQWLSQVHGVEVIKAGTGEEIPTADACWTDQPGQACVVMTADCLPVCFSDGKKVAVAHAGWRGLVSGVLEQTLAVFDDPSQVHVWLGPAIGPEVFEVGSEVKAAFEEASPSASKAAISKAFKPQSAEGKWLADIYQLARIRLGDAGVCWISGGDYCTYSDPQFFSYRRQSTTGRIATVVWLSQPEQ